MLPNPSITILCAGPGLGFYVPGAILARRLRRRLPADSPVELAVLEALLPPVKQELVRQSRQAFHRDFRVALMGQRLAKDISGELDPARVTALLERWRAEDRRRFVVFSGFWVPLVERYLRDYAAGPVAIDFCHVDAAASASWGLVRSRAAGIREVWFLSWEDRQQHYWLDISGEAPLSWEARSGGLLAHGGGWGMGTYRERVEPLLARQQPLDLLCYDPAEIVKGRPEVRSFLLDPQWFPWTLAPQDCLFPPLSAVDSGGAYTAATHDEYPPLFQLIRRAPAMISKPGGGTLIDSFAAATPLLLLEPFGEYERKSGVLWTELGFALPFADWVADGCRLEALATLHRNLLRARGRITDYAEQLCTEQIGGET